MTDQILAAAVTGLSVSPDGEAVRLQVKTFEGDVASLTMPSTLLSSLTMSLFGAADKAFKLREGDESVKLVFPADRFELKETDCGARFILSLETPDGFQASFAVPQGVLIEIGELAADHAPRQYDVRALN